MASTRKPSVCVNSIEMLLKNPQISIPPYQRPYKWSLTQINQLINDILKHRNKSAYRLGTLVLHQNEETESGRLDIVDGQQRMISLNLIALALLNEAEGARNIPHHSNWKFSHPISQANIYQNYQLIQQRIQDFDPQSISFFLKKCQMVVLKILDLSAAFQFFDSQNSRGRSLVPHDLLKAFHLREMSGNSQESERKQIVEKWENYETDELNHFFSNYLFRVKHWVKGKEARYFSKDQIEVFKGINPHDNVPPFAMLHSLGNTFLEKKNQEPEMKLYQQTFPFPFQLDSLVLNGKRFFEMINHYADRIVEVQELGKDKVLDRFPLAKEILRVLDSYPSGRRIGDRHVRNLFDCYLLYYIDKFGVRELDRVVKIFFLDAYTIRVNRKAVQLSTVDNHARYGGLFNVLREALRPEDVMQHRIPKVESEPKGTRIQEIKKLFEDFKHINK